MNMRERSEQIFQEFAEESKKTGFNEGARFSIDIIQSPDDLVAVRYLQARGLVYPVGFEGSPWAFTPTGIQKARALLAA